MPNTQRDYQACQHCTFLQFCQAEENNAYEGKITNHTVKHYRTLKKNDVLFLPNNRFQNLYVIQRGALKTYQAEADGKELIRGFYFASEILGYEAICAGSYPFSAIALTETVVCEIPYENFLSLLEHDTNLQKSILFLISQQLSSRSYLLFSNAEQRLAAFLLDLSSRLYPSDIRFELSLPMSRQDMGNYLRLTAETVSRLLSRLQRHRLIGIGHKQINLLEITKLRKIAQGFSSVL
jgi:CRP/FNR family transcriptional regulator